MGIGNGPPLCIHNNIINIRLKPDTIWCDFDSFVSFVSRVVYACDWRSHSGQSDSVAAGRRSVLFMRAAAMRFRLPRVRSFEHVRSSTVLGRSICWAELEAPFFLMVGFVGHTRIYTKITNYNPRQNNNNINVLYKKAYLRSKYNRFCEPYSV